MRKVLFVDDEPNILSGLRRMLRKQRKAWEMDFAGSGEHALSLMREKSYDVIVSDMVMPQMDGAELLSRVQAHWPQVVRLVLSGHCDVEATVRAIPVAHQFLAKPCEPGVLQRVIERSCQLRELLDSDELRGVVGAVDHLPGVPESYQKLVAMLGGDECTVEEITEIVLRDPALAAKILQLVNSSFFGLAQQISTVKDAVSYLGKSMIRNIVLASEVFAAFEKIGVASSFSLQRAQDHATVVAQMSRAIAPAELADDAFMAGLLHDVGKLVIASRMPELCEEVMEACRGDAHGCPCHIAEHELCGTTHAQLGAYLLGLWGVPAPVVEAVAFHHRPHEIAHPTFDLTAIVHVANGLVMECYSRCAEEESMDEAFLAEIGVDAARIDGWRGQLNEVLNLAGATP